MLRFAIRRVATLVPTLFVIITLSFLIIRLAPGGPFDEEQTLSPAIRANLDEAYGLDQPIATQYVRHRARLAPGDFGPSTTLPRTTLGELTGHVLPVSLSRGWCATFRARTRVVPVGTLCV